MIDESWVSDIVSKYNERLASKKLSEEVFVLKMSILREQGPILIGEVYSTINELISTLNLNFRKEVLVLSDEAHGIFKISRSDISSVFIEINFNHLAGRNALSWVLYDGCTRIKGNLSLAFADLDVVFAKQDGWQMSCHDVAKFLIEKVMQVTQ